MIDPEIITLIGNIGFPIAITIYLLVTRDQVITKNTEAIQRMSSLVEDYILKQK